MRVEKNNPRQTYRDFRDWLRTGSHPVLALSLSVAYLYYLNTTYEV